LYFMDDQSKVFYLLLNEVIRYSTLVYNRQGI
jgi:hypothetical protein